MTNPLQQYFRQPKIYIKLPSKGIFTKPGTIQGDANKLPIYGMTGMDEIMAKTPDALLSGESVVKIMESCCPSIKDGWDLSTIDTNLLLVAIRIATYGSAMTVAHTCSACSTENEYELDLVKIIDYYAGQNYVNTVDLDQLTVKLKPLNYRQISELAIKSFKIQQQAAQLIRISQNQELTEEQDTQLKQLYSELANMQNEIYKMSVESVETGNMNVTEQKFILEWLDNADATVFDAIKAVAEQNTKAFAVPTQPVTCSNCSAATEIAVEFDNSNFFAKA